MAKKIAVVTLLHTCDEDPCHLNNESQANWIKEILSSGNRLSWNWKIDRISVVDIKE